MVSVISWSVCPCASLSSQVQCLTLQLITETVNYGRNKFYDTGPWSLCQNIENFVASNFEIDARKIFWQQFMLILNSYFLMTVFIDIELYFKYINIYCLLERVAVSLGGSNSTSPDHVMVSSPKSKKTFYSTSQKTKKKFVSVEKIFFML